VLVPFCRKVPEKLKTKDVSGRRKVIAVIKMWGNNDYESSGGFQSSQSADTPGGSDKKRARAQNLVPVHVQEINEAPEEGLVIEGRPVGMVEFIGTVKSVDVQSSKTLYVVEDATGSIQAIHWTDGEKASGSDETINEGDEVRVTGVVRSTKGEKHIMVFRVAPIQGGKAEADAHRLEVVYAKIKIRQLVDKENAAIGGNSNNSTGLSNSMVGGFGGSTGMNAGGGGGMGGSAGGGGSSFSNSKHETVFKMLQGCNRDEGLHRDEVLQGLKGRLNKKEVDEALTYLSDEGHIYATMDEDHFKTTDD